MYYITLIFIINGIEMTIINFLTSVIVALNIALVIFKEASSKLKNKMISRQKPETRNE